MWTLTLFFCACWVSLGAVPHVKTDMGSETW